MSDQILWNSAALGALKRHQLVSLSKRYGLRASGKNVDMVERLQEYAASLPPHLKLYLPEPAPTPAPTSAAIMDEPPPSPTPIPASLREMPIAPNYAGSRQKLSASSRASENWEVLSESGASLVSPPKGKSGSISSWKSACNGECLNEFGGVSEHKSDSTRSRSSMLDFASSLKRTASRTLMFGRSASNSSDLSQMSQHANSHDEDQPAPVGPGPVEDMPDLPPSPTSTVGVPRRHSTISILERPSTIRLCSPAPPEPSPSESATAEDNLPFVGAEFKLQAIRDRRSMAPIRSPVGMTASLSSTNLGRKSMPALPSSTSASLSNIYPPLPVLAAPPVPPLPPMPSTSPTSTMPGALPQPSVVSPKPFVFGPKGDAGVTQANFSEAAQAVLREMNAKLPDHARKLDGELLKGKKAEMKRLVSVNDKLGEGGWGLKTSAAGKDRFAEAHEREFAKMASISASSSIKPRTLNMPSAAPGETETAESKVKRKFSDEIVAGPSAPNGAPLVPVDSRATKRSRLSIGPNYLGTLREAGKSLANMLADADGKPANPSLAKKMKEKRDRRRSSLIKSKGRSISSKFGFLRASKKSVPATSLTNSKTKTTSASVPPLPKSSLGSHVTDPDGGSSIARKDTTAARRRSAELTNLVKRAPVLPSEAPPTSFLAQGQPQKSRLASSSASTVLSSMSSKIRPRPRIPDFDAPTGSKVSTSSVTTLGLPKTGSIGATGSGSSGKSMRKQSQADIIRSARPAPPPPSEVEAVASDKIPTQGVMLPPSSTMKRSSTLYNPTASSLARMQATVKPSMTRPPPVPPPPSISTSKPFGQGSSRGNKNLFASNFNIPKPHPSPAPVGQSSITSPNLGKGPSAPGARTPLRPTSLAAARARAKASGLSAVKSKGNLKGEVDMQRRKAEIRAKQERMAEERGLREMLGQVGGSAGVGQAM